MIRSHACRSAVVIAAGLLLLAACGTSDRERAAATRECSGVPPRRIEVEGTALDSASRCVLVYAALKTLGEAPRSLDVRPRGEVPGAWITLISRRDSSGSVTQRFYLVDIPLADRAYDAEVQMDYSTADMLPRRTLKPRPR